MPLATMLVFTATVLPLICTPGPDMFFVTSQAISGGATAGLRATAGVCLGYVVHSILVALGVAAIIAASPILFEALRWVGVAYLIYLAFRLIRSAMRTGTLAFCAEAATGQLRRGFLSAFLNPKGMMIYFAILPQFIRHDGGIAIQAAILSAIFVGLCGIVFTLLSLIVGMAGKNGGFTDRGRRWVEGVAGGLLLVAASRIAST